jgi:hypothetical protein
MELVRRLDPTRPALNNEDVSYTYAGPKIAKWRRDHNQMSQVAFAKLAKVSVGCLQGLETGTRATRELNLDKIATVMGLSREELLSADESVPQPSPDPRLKELTSEDLQIARLFHGAVTEVRASVKAQLRAAAELARKEIELESVPFPALIERRSGHERRRPIDHSDAQRRELIAKLEKLAPAMTARFRELLEIGTDDWSLEFAARVFRQPSEIRSVLDSNLAHIEKRQADGGAESAEKKSGSKKKP